MEETKLAPRKRQRLEDWEEPEELTDKRKGCYSAIFTWNNYPEDWWERLLEIPHKYIIGAPEIAPTTGTPHIQGYIQFLKQTKWSALAKKLHASFKTAYATFKQNYEYCRKIRQKDRNDGTPPNPIWKESGTPSESGGKKIKEYYISLYEDVKSGLDYVDLGPKYPEYILRHGYKKCEEIRLKLKGRNVTTLPGPCGLWIYGESGKGKTTYARLLVGVPMENVGLNKICLPAEKERQYYYPKQWNKWWDGYEFQDNVIADDMGLPHNVLGSHIKHWADEIQFNCEIKGAMVFIRPKKFIITSQYTPSQIWTDKETLDAIYRRFKIKKVLGYNEETKETDVIDMTREGCDDEAKGWRDENIKRITNEKARMTVLTKIAENHYWSKNHSGGIEAVLSDN